MLTEWAQSRTAGFALIGGRAWGNLAESGLTALVRWATAPDVPLASEAAQNIRRIAKAKNIYI